MTGTSERSCDDHRVDADERGRRLVAAAAGKQPRHENRTRRRRMRSVLLTWAMVIRAPRGASAGCRRQRMISGICQRLTA